jgi:putative solute:sodium symporter small subunit
MAMPEDVATMQADSAHRRYWQRNLRITGALLVVWFFVTFVLGFYARELNFIFFGWPFSFWVASQGAVIVYCLIVWFYAYAMRKLEREYGAGEAASEG